MLATGIAGETLDHLNAVILHRHVLFRDLIETELHDLGPVEICGTATDPDAALELVLGYQARALVIEAAEGFVGRHQMLDLFCQAAEVIPEFVLISADLATSRIELLQDTVSHRPHLAELRPLLMGAPL